MKKIKGKGLCEQLLLYAITPEYDGSEQYFEKIEASLRGGATVLQLREKNLQEEALEQLAKRIKALCDNFSVPLIINDNPYLAEKIGAAGVHLGQDDLDIAEARKIVGDKIIGISAHNVQEALAAEQAGADYLGAGACFVTNSKSNIIPIELNVLDEMTAAVEIPVVAIGGITRKNVERLSGRGLTGVAVISALFSAEDVERATKEFLEELKR